jgi:hypothetical protein
MRIHDLQLNRTNGAARLSARVVWEDCDRPEQEIYYEARGSFADSIAYLPEPFVTAAAIPAMRHGERRLAVEGEVCPELCEGLDVAMKWLNQWYGSERTPLAIEAAVRRSAPAPMSPPRAACFFTGGVDSMATLRRNRVHFAENHPLYIRDAVIIYGLEVERGAAFDAVLKSLAFVVNDAGAELLPVYTNVRSLDLNWTFWEFQWEAAVYASVAHALSRRLTTVSISSTYDIPNMRPLGSHPLLDSNYGSGCLRVRHDGITMSRLDKLRVIAGWDVGLQRLRVCNNVEHYRKDTINCAQCEKCIRTMLGLAALGVLERTTAFPAGVLTPELVVSRATCPSHLESSYKELLAPLAAQGRHDLAAAVSHLLRDCRGEFGFRGAFRRIDRQVLAGRLRAVKQAVFPTS